MSKKLNLAAMHNRKVQADRKQLSNVIAGKNVNSGNLNLEGVVCDCSNPDSDFVDSYNIMGNIPVPPKGPPRPDIPVSCDCGWGYQTFLFLFI